MAAESLDLVEPSSASAAAASAVLGRLRAREEARAAEAAKRLEELQVASDPRESVDAFMSDFAARRSALLQGLEVASGGQEGAAPALTPEEAKAAVVRLATDVAELEKAVAAAAYFLPQYDLRQCTLAVGALREAQEAAATALQPRKRFAFSRKASAPGPAAPAAVQQPKQQQVQGKQDQQDLHEHEHPSASASSSGTGIRGLSNQTVVHRCAADGTEDLTLADLHNCTLFLLGPIAALFAHRLRGCHVYTGPVAGAMFIEDARDCTLMLAARQARIHAAQACDFYLRLRSQPIIEHSSGLRFAPYAFDYPGAAADLAAQSLEQENGRWQEVQDFGWLRATPSPHWSVLPEAERQLPPAVPDTSGGSSVKQLATQQSTEAASWPAGATRVE